MLKALQQSQYVKLKPDNYLVGMIQDPDPEQHEK